MTARMYARNSESSTQLPPLDESLTPNRSSEPGAICPTLEEVTMPECSTCNDRHRVMVATTKPEWKFLGDPKQLVNEDNPLPPFPGSGQSMYEFTESPCPDCTKKTPDSH